MCEFDFDIKHIQGKENKVVDALSRRVHAMHDLALVCAIIFENHNS